MLLAAFIIFWLEILAIYWLEQKYCRPGEEKISVEEFICRASLDDILRYRHHAISSWIALGVMTISSAWRH